MVPNNFRDIGRQGPTGEEFSKSRYLCPVGLIACSSSTLNLIPILTSIPTFGTGFPHTQLLSTECLVSYDLTQLSHCLSRDSTSQPPSLEV